MSDEPDNIDDFEALLAESARVAAEFDNADSDDYAESIQPDLVERSDSLWYLTKVHRRTKFQSYLHHFNKSLISQKFLELFL